MKYATVTRPRLGKPSSSKLMSRFDKSHKASHSISCDRCDHLVTQNLAPVVVARDKTFSPPPSVHMNPPPTKPVQLHHQCWLCHLFSNNFRSDRSYFPNIFHPWGTAIVHWHLPPLSTIRLTLSPKSQTLAHVACSIKCIDLVANRSMIKNISKEFVVIILTQDLFYLSMSYEAPIELLSPAREPREEWFLFPPLQTNHEKLEKSLPHFEKAIQHSKGYYETLKLEFENLKKTLHNPCCYILLKRSWKRPPSRISCCWAMHVKTNWREKTSWSRTNERDLSEELPQSNSNSEKDRSYLYKS